LELPRLVESRAATIAAVDDPDHLKVFANVDAAETWFEEDPEGGHSKTQRLCR
jgi:hypothetical protein